MRFPRQEYWSRLPFPSPGDPLTQGSNPCLLHHRWILYHWATWATKVVSHLSHVRLFVTLWTVACQAPLSVGQMSIGFSRKEYWSRLPCPPPGDISDPGIEPVSVASPASASGLFTTLGPCWMYLASWSVLPFCFSDLGLCLLSLWILFQGHCLFPLHLFGLVGFYLAYQHISLFHLILSNLLCLWSLFLKLHAPKAAAKARYVSVVEALVHLDVLWMLGLPSLSWGFNPWLVQLHREISVSLPWLHSPWAFCFGFDPTSACGPPSGICYLPRQEAVEALTDWGRLAHLCGKGKR